MNLIYGLIGATQCSSQLSANEAMKDIYYVPHICLRQLLSYTLEADIIWRTSEMKTNRKVLVLEMRVTGTPKLRERCCLNFDGLNPR